MKRVAILLLQLLVTAGAVWYVFHDPHKREQIAAAFTKADARWLIFGLGGYSAVEILAAIRWQILLRIQGIRLGWFRSFGIVIIGLFFNMFLPGLIGGDLVRLYFVFKRVPRQKARATLSVVMDRLFGLMSILLLGALSLSLRFQWFATSSISMHVAYIALALLTGGAILVVLLFVAAHFRWLQKLPKTTPFRKTLVESGEALELYRSHSAMMALALVITIASHLALYVSYFCAGRSLHAAGHVASLIDMLTIMPLVNTITAIPISFGGAGVRELLFQQLLGQLAHVPSALAAFSASLGFAIQATWGLIGAVVYLLSKKISSHP